MTKFSSGVPFFRIQKRESIPEAGRSCFLTSVAAAKREHFNAFYFISHPARTYCLPGGNRMLQGNYSRDSGHSAFRQGRRRFRSGGTKSVPARYTQQQNP